MKKLFSFRLFFPFIALFLLSLASCHKEPSCIQKRIVDFKHTQVTSSAKVDRYSFQGNTVYVFELGDFEDNSFTEVVDADCNTLGHLGGYMGTWRINGQNFFNEATYEATVWSN